MSGWEAYLPPVADVSESCGIVSLQGSRCGKKGNWKASTAEEQNYAQLLNNITSATTKGLTYGGKKYIVSRAVDDTIIAQCAKEGLVLQKSKSVLVAAHTVEGQVLSNAASKVAYVVAQLVNAGC
jgi:transcriptional regulator CtsR